MSSTEPRTTIPDKTLHSGSPPRRTLALRSYALILCLLAILTSFNLISSRAYAQLPPTPDHKETSKSEGAKPNEVKTDDRALSRAPAELSGQSQKPKPDLKTSDSGIPVILAGAEAFRFYVQLGPYSPELRAQTLQRRLQELEHEPSYVESIQTAETSFSTDIVTNGITLLTITDADARAAGYANRKLMAREAASRLKELLLLDMKERTPRGMLVAAALTAVTTGVLVGLLIFFGWLFPHLYATVLSQKGNSIRPLKIQRAELLSQETITAVLIGTLRLIRVTTVIVALLVYVQLVLSYFPDTRFFSDQVTTYLAAALVNFLWPSIVNYVPHLAFIVFSGVVTYYLLAFTKFIFNEIERGDIAISGFDADWSLSTYKIARFLIVCCCLAVIYPHLPGAGSSAFQGLSIFLGLLVSIGSTASVQHIVAGIFLTYTRAFKIGDRVKIADTIGDVTDKTLLATTIRTIKYEYITIPNGLIIGSHIVNYSTSTGHTGLILHTALSIGYDVPWRQVHDLLIKAALKTEKILSEPSPFVLQTNLNDSYACYEINAYTNAVGAMADTYSSLHQNIQDEFNAAAIEIMSPQYHALRDGNRVTNPGANAPSRHNAFEVRMHKLESAAVQD